MNIFHRFSSVSIVGFEQVNVSYIWAAAQTWRKICSNLENSDRYLKFHLFDRKRYLSLKAVTIVGYSKEAYQIFWFKWYDIAYIVAWLLKNYLTKIYRHRSQKNIRFSPPASIYLFKVSTRNTRKRCEIWSKCNNKGTKMTSFWYINC